MVYNVKISGNTTEINKKSIIAAPAPEGETPIPVISPNQFQVIADSYGTYMNNYWIVGYEYKIKKGETISAQFYAPDLNNGEPAATPGEIIIDVRLTKSGTAEGTAETLGGTAIALDMYPIRSQFVSSSNKSVNVKFRFHVENQSGLHTTESYVMKAVEQ